MFQFQTQMTVNHWFGILDKLKRSCVGGDKDLQMAVGNLDLNTLERIDHFDPDKQVSLNRR